MSPNSDTYAPPRRRKRGLISRILHLGANAAAGTARAAATDTQVIVQNTRLIIGIVFIVFGVLSFASDRYCDGNVSSYLACTRPSTYYYYPWWAVMLTIVGVVLVTLWYLRRATRTRS